MLVLFCVFYLKKLSVNVGIEYYVTAKFEDLL